jgi:hypothetical protein
MSRRAAQTYRGEWTGRAIGLDIDIDADPNVLASLTFRSTINGFVLSRRQGTEPNEHHKCQTHSFHITSPQSSVTRHQQKITPAAAAGATRQDGSLSGGRGRAIWRKGIMNNLRSTQLL